MVHAITVSDRCHLGADMVLCITHQAPLPVDQPLEASTSPCLPPADLPGDGVATAASIYSPADADGVASQTLCLPPGCPGCSCG